jgi:hypothetical protein
MKVRKKEMGFAAHHTQESRTKPKMPINSKTEKSNENWKILD